MPLLFLPDLERPFVWLSDAERLQPAWLGSAGDPHSTYVVTPQGAVEVSGRCLPLLQTAAQLAALPAAELDALPASVASWALASKLALELVARERVVPTLQRRGERLEARWAVALAAEQDASRVAALAGSMPPSAHAVPIDDGDGRTIWAPDALLRAYLDAVADALVRAARGGPTLPIAARRKTAAWDARFVDALAGEQRAFETQGFAERNVVPVLERWSEPALGVRDRLRACFRLELPAGARDAFLLRFLLQAPEDPSLLVSATEVWATQGRRLERLGRAFRDPQESLLEALGRAARLFAPIANALATARPEALELDPAAAWSFLSEAAPALTEAGFGVIVPSELTAAGQRRLRLRMRIGGTSRKVAGAVSGAAGLALDELLEVNWEAVVGDRTLSARELATLARHKAPLVRFRGAWVALDPLELAQISERVTDGPSRITLREAVQAALVGQAHDGGLPVGVAPSGGFAKLIERLQHGAASEHPAPRSLQAQLRPYQARGLGWLVTMVSLGLGGCLADDMGLGKTMQWLALLLARLESAPDDVRPALLVAPTSVLGNWEREIARFAPALRPCPHYGAERARSASDLPRGRGVLVLTSYAVLRRDAALLAEVDWAVVALDEAQNIKNAASATAIAARGLRAAHRFALTGTPVENRLAELWSILEFGNPGLLGPLAAFRREFAVPIERYRDAAAAERLRRMVGPFILRRLKTDPTIAQDLPAKHEMKVVCTLTREQASLYKAVVDEELARIASSDGMERRGRVLALLSATQQICNHPAQYLSERAPLAQRSGKLSRVTEMLEEALASDDKALVFTRYREMGGLLVDHLQTELGVEVAFLHGGTPKLARDALVHRFQIEARGPRVFVLSVKAGGTGLNLTAASHVFHYDRWWNPAVEDQATDRAHRIGQTRAVQVHKLLCAGTVEEKVDRMLEQKRELAAQVVAAGERWITELGTDELRDLFALSQGAVASAEDDEASSTTAPPVPGGKRRGRREVRA